MPSQVHGCRNRRRRIAAHKAGRNIRRDQCPFADIPIRRDGQQRLGRPRRQPGKRCPIGANHPRHASPVTDTASRPRHTPRPSPHSPALPPGSTALPAGASRELVKRLRIAPVRRHFRRPRPADDPARLERHDAHRHRPTRPYQPRMAAEGVGDSPAPLAGSSTSTNSGTGCPEPAIPGCVIATAREPPHTSPRPSPSPARRRRPCRPAPARKGRPRADRQRLPPEIQPRSPRLVALHQRQPRDPLMRCPSPEIPPALMQAVNDLHGINQAGHPAKSHGGKFSVTVCPGRKSSQRVSSCAVRGITPYWRRSASAYGECRDRIVRGRQRVDPRHIRARLRPPHRRPETVPRMSP